MDGHRFDQLTKSLSAGMSRRGLVRGAVASIAGLALTAVGRRAGAAPNSCSVGCANLKGPQKAACRQACQQCNGDFNRVCFEFGPFGPINFVCCSEGTFCVAEAGVCCPTGTQPCFGPEGVTCCPEGTFCNFDTGQCADLTFCPTGEPAENCFAGITTDCAEGACALADDVDSDECQCIERACGDPCASSADCGGGPCVEVPGCCPDLRFCATPCGATGTTIRSAGWR